MTVTVKPDRRTEQESRLNAALAELSSAIISPATSFDEMYRFVLQKARLLTESRHGFVSSIDPKTQAHISNTLTEMRQEGCTVEATLYALPSEPHGQYPGLWGHSLNQRAGFYTNNPSAHPAAQGLPAGHLPLKNFLSVPVMFGGAALGQIALANSPRDYTEDDLKTVERLGELYAVVLHNRKREDELRASEERFRLMVEAAPFPMIVTRLADHTVLYTNPRASERFGLSQQEAIGKKVFDFYVQPEHRHAVIADIRKRGLSQDKVVMLRNMQGTPFWALLSAVKVDWLGNEVVMTAINDITDRKNMEEELKRLATIDNLTGIFNRRCFMEKGNHEFQRWLRYKKPFCVIIFDLDHFKQVNDTYGHQAGDLVLAGTAQAALAELRTVDVAGRYGGEEFAIILPETGCDEAMNVAERLRQSIAERNYQLSDCDQCSVTASFGIGEVAGGDRNFENIITRADNALYKAKFKGRNQLVCC